MGNIANTSREMHLAWGLGCHSEHVRFAGRCWVLPALPPPPPRWGRMESEPGGSTAGSRKGETSPRLENPQHPSLGSPPAQPGWPVLRDAPSHSLLPSGAKSV